MKASPTDDTIPPSQGEQWPPTSQQARELLAGGHISLAQFEQMTGEKATVDSTRKRAKVGKATGIAGALIAIVTALSQVPWDLVLDFLTSFLQGR